jgi:hypothetical protein
MARRAKKKLTTYHATMIVTRTEEWCIEAESEDEALSLLEAGEGHRCDIGTAEHVELGEMHRSH